MITHLTALLPTDQSNSEILIIRGPWPDGITHEQIRFVRAVRPGMARVVNNLLDGARVARQREQFGALAELSSAFSKAEGGR